MSKIFSILGSANQNGYYTFSVVSEYLFAEFIGTISAQTFYKMWVNALSWVAINTMLRDSTERTSVNAKLPPRKFIMGQYVRI